MGKYLDALKQEHYSEATTYPPDSPDTPIHSGGLSGLSVDHLGVFKKNAPGESQGISGEVIAWPHPGKPLSRRQVWGFLVPCPFTRTMLEKATELYQEPLDAADWTDIQAGKYLFENKEHALRQYLDQWADDHPRKMQRLIDEFFPENPRDKP